jgi:membrane-associated protein
MPSNRPVWQINTLRLLLWGCVGIIVWAICQETAFAQDGAAPTDEGFWGPLITNLLNYDGLMRVLSKPGYFWTAFVALNLIVFVETGLLIGFFLPGDSLLVIVGLICANPESGWNMPLLLASLSAAAVIGDTVGYWIGFKSGPKIFNREKSLFFAKDHLLKAQAFYEKHGAVTIILARFVPFLRTFAPVVAGVGKMEYKKFFLYNIVGGVAWVFSMILAGRFLPIAINPLMTRMTGNEFHVEHHIEKVVVIVVFLSILPIVYAWLKKMLASKPIDPPQLNDTALSTH